MYKLYKAGKLIDTCDTIRVAREMCKFYGDRCYIQYTVSGIIKYEGKSLIESEAV
jgi:hypothetical protein